MIKKFYLDIDNPKGGLYHYGVKGMKWGVRRTPEQLGHLKCTVDKSKEHSIMSNETVLSKKGFMINGSKIVDFLLKPKAKHSHEFFNVGYTPQDSRRLFEDIEKGYDLSKATDVVKINDIEKFSIFMNLGITSKRPFRTVWQIDGQNSKPRLITAHREDKNV